MGALSDRGTASVQVGDKVSATLYSQAALHGRAESFSASDRNLADNLIGAYTAVSLRVQLRTTQPAAPALISPGPLTADDSVLLSWSNPGGAVDFNPQLYAAGNPVPFAQREFKPGVSWPLGSLPAGNYTWQVQGRVLNSAGEPITGGWGSGSFAVAESPAVTAAPAAFPYEATFEGGASGWEARGDWGTRAMTDAQGQPTQAFVYNHAGTCVDGVRCSGSLTSPPVLLPASGQAYLRFNHQYNAEAAMNFWDRRWIMYSYSSTPTGPYSRWLNLFELSGDPSGAWLPGPDSQDLLLVNSGILAGKYVRIRFFYDSVDTLANSSTSWAIDNIRIDAVPPAAAGEANEPNNNKTAEATWITIGTSHSGVISPNGDVDYFRFSAVKGQVLLADVSNQGSSMVPTVALLDTDGINLLAQSAGPGSGGSGTARIGFAVPQSGVYFLRVRPGNFPAGGAGAVYALSLTQAADTARPAIQLLSPLSGQALKPWPLAVSVEPNDGSGTGISHVDFFYHLPDWINECWTFIGSDWNGADGWGLSYSPGLLPEVYGFSLWVRAYDWALNPADVISYQAWEGTRVSTFMPLVTR